MVDLVVMDPVTDNGWRANEQGNNRITTMDGGQEQRLQKWAFGKKSYTIPYHLMSQSQYQALRDFAELRQFTARGFLIWDASSFYAAAQPIGTGNGAATQFQIQITKSDAGNTVVKPVLHPMPTGTPIPIQYQGIPGGHTTTLNTITVNGVTKTEGTDYTISPSTGIATFAAAVPAGYAIVWTGWYFVPVRFDGDRFELELDSVYASSNPNLIELFNE